MDKLELRNEDKSVIQSVQRYLDENNLTFEGFHGENESPTLKHRIPGETAGDSENLAVLFANFMCDRAHELMYKHDEQTREIQLGASTVQVSAEARAKRRMLKALDIYEKCRLVPEACFQLGLCYEHGKGVRMNLERAKELYREAFEEALSLARADIFSETGPRKVRC